MNSVFQYNSTNVYFYPRGHHISLSYLRIVPDSYSNFINDAHFPFRTIETRNPNCLSSWLSCSFTASIFFFESLYPIILTAYLQTFIKTSSTCLFFPFTLLNSLTGSAICPFFYIFSLKLTILTVYLVCFTLISSMLFIFPFEPLNRIV